VGKIQVGGSIVQQKFGAACMDLHSFTLWTGLKLHLIVIINRYIKTDDFGWYCELVSIKRIIQFFIFKQIFVKVWAGQTVKDWLRSHVLYFMLCMRITANACIHAPAYILKVWMPKWLHRIYINSLHYNQMIVNLYWPTWHINEC